MKKLLKFGIGVLSGFILILYVSSLFVKIEDNSYNILEYLKYIIGILGETIKRTDITQIQMFWIVLAWLLIIVCVAAPIICLIIVCLKGILGGIFTKKNLKCVGAICTSFIFSGILIAGSYYLVYKLENLASANDFIKELVKISASNIWQPILYISAFGSLFLMGVNILVNSMNKKRKEEDEDSQEK